MTKITVNKNGSLRVEGDVTICDPEGRTFGAALSPPALALQRVILAEATRFPELAMAVNREGARGEAVRAISALLRREVSAGSLSISDTEFAADQFIFMLVAGPQRRALGLGVAMTEGELDAWSRDTVGLFLNGCRGAAPR